MYNKFRRTTAAVLAALCAVSLFAMSGCDDDNVSLDAVDSQEDYVVPVPDEVVDENEAGATVNAVVGKETVYNGNIVVKVDAVRELDKMKSASSRILFFEVTVTNESDKELDLSFLTHFAADVDGKTYGAGRSAVANSQASGYYYDKGLTLLHTPLSAKQAATEEKPNTATGIVPMMIPAEFDKLQFVYTPYKYTSNDVVVFDITEDVIQHITETE